MKWNQKDFSEIGGVTKTSQVNYESGERSPNVDYLQAITSAGVDVQYIITDVRKELQDSLDVVETLLNATLWGAYLENPEQRFEIATHLNTLIETSERHNSFSPNVMIELKRISDALVQIDNLPDQIRPFLRP